MKTNIDSVLGIMLFILIILTDSTIADVTDECQIIMEETHLSECSNPSETRPRKVHGMFNDTLCHDSLGMHHYYNTRCLCAGLVKVESSLHCQPRCEDVCLNGGRYNSPFDANRPKEEPACECQNGFYGDFCHQHYRRCKLQSKKKALSYRPCKSLEFKENTECIYSSNRNEWLCENSYLPPKDPNIPFCDNVESQVTEENTKDKQTSESEEPNQGGTIRDKTTVGVVLSVVVSVIAFKVV